MSREGLRDGIYAWGERIVSLMRSLPGASRKFLFRNVNKAWH